MNMKILILTSLLLLTACQKEMVTIGPIKLFARSQVLSSKKNLCGCSVSLQYQGNTLVYSPDQLAAGVTPLADYGSPVTWKCYSETSDFRVIKLEIAQRTDTTHTPVVLQEFTFEGDKKEASGVFHAK